MAILRPKPLNPKTIYRGETFRGRLPIVEGPTLVSPPKDLTGCTVRWALLNADSTLALPERSLLSGGISFENGDPTLGVLIVTVFDEETETLLPATYEQEFYMTDNIDDVGIYQGKVFVEDSVLWATA